MDKKEKSALAFEVFENISKCYDSANDRISLGMQRGWKEQVIDRVTILANSSDTLLDVCCGTGDIAINIAKRRDDLKVVGLDFSPNMLEVAKNKGVGLNNIIWTQGDAMKLPFEDESFDLATICFGLRNTGDYEGVMKEIMRVIKKGGYIFCLDSFVPTNPFIKPFYNLYFKYLMPIIGGGRKKYREYTWLFRSTQEFLSKNELIELFKNLGIKDIKDTSRLFGACILIQGKK